MDILIKGMTMPKHGMVINIYADGRVSNHFDEFCETIATAVPVPQHGRLIDADVAEVISFAEEEADGKNFADGILYAADWIAEQPTIIPADKEGET